MAYITPDSFGPKHANLEKLELYYMEKYERKGRLSERENRNLKRVQARLIAIERGDHSQHAQEPLRTARA